MDASHRPEPEPPPRDPGDGARDDDRRGDDRRSDEDRRRLGATFDTAAELYDRVRPQPAVAALDWFVPAGARRAVDLGAGTGKLTRRLAEHGLQTVAVDTSPAMLAVLRGHLPGVQVLLGPAEHVELPDGWADVVTASLAFHWFERPTVDVEMHRLLRPGGVVALINNHVDPGDRLGAALRAAAGRVPALAAARGQLADRPDPRRLRLAGDLFEPAELAEFREPAEVDLDSAVGAIGSRSYVLDLPPEVQRQVLGELRRALVAELGGATTVATTRLTVVSRSVRR